MQNEPRSGRQVAASGRVAGNSTKGKPAGLGGHETLEWRRKHPSCFVFAASSANSIDSSLLLQCLEVTPGVEMNVLS